MFIPVPLGRDSGSGDGRRSSGGIMLWLDMVFAGELMEALPGVTGSLGGDKDLARSVVRVNKSGPIWNCAINTEWKPHLPFELVCPYDPAQSLLPASAYAPRLPYLA